MHNVNNNSCQITTTIVAATLTSVLTLYLMRRITEQARYRLAAAAIGGGTVGLATYCSVRSPKVQEIWTRFRGSKEVDPLSNDEEEIPPFPLQGDLTPVYGDANQLILVSGALHTTEAPLLITADQVSTLTGHIGETPLQTAGIVITGEANSDALRELGDKLRSLAGAEDRLIPLLLSETEQIDVTVEFLQQWLGHLQCPNLKELILPPGSQLTAEELNALFTAAPFLNPNDNWSGGDQALLAIIKAQKEALEDSSSSSETDLEDPIALFPLEGDVLVYTTLGISRLGEALTTIESPFRLKASQIAQLNTDIGDSPIQTQGIIIADEINNPAALLALGEKLLTATPEGEHPIPIQLNDTKSLELPLGFLVNWLPTLYCPELEQLTLPEETVFDTEQLGALFKACPKLRPDERWCEGDMERLALVNQQKDRLAALSESSSSSETEDDGPRFPLGTPSAVYSMIGARIQHDQPLWNIKRPLLIYADQINHFMNEIGDQKLDAKGVRIQGYPIDGASLIALSEKLNPTPIQLDDAEHLELPADFLTAALPQLYCPTLKTLTLTGENKLTLEQLQALWTACPMLRPEQDLCDPTDEDAVAEIDARRADVPEPIESEDSSSSSDSEDEIDQLETLIQIYKWHLLGEQPEGGVPPEHGVSLAFMRRPEGLRRHQAMRNDALFETKNVLQLRIDELRDFLNHVGTRPLKATGILITGKELTVDEWLRFIENAPCSVEDGAPLPILLADIETLELPADFPLGWLSRLYCPQLRQLTFAGECSLSENQVEELSHCCPNLEILTLQSCIFTARQIQMLIANCPNLQPQLAWCDGDEEALAAVNEQLRRLAPPEEEREEDFLIGDTPVPGQLPPLPHPEPHPLVSVLRDYLEGSDQIKQMYRPGYGGMLQPALRRDALLNTKHVLKLENGQQDELLRDMNNKPLTAAPAIIITGVINSAAVVKFVTKLQELAGEEEPTALILPEVEELAVEAGFLNKYLPRLCCPNLKQLTLTSADRLTNASAKLLMGASPNLQLDLSWFDSLDAMEALQAARGVRKLKLTDEQLASLDTWREFGLLNGVIQLDLTACTAIDVTAVAALGKMPRLSFITLPEGLDIPAVRDPLLQRELHGERITLDSPYWSFATPSDSQLAAAAPRLLPYLQEVASLNNSNDFGALAAKSRSKKVLAQQYVKRREAGEIPETLADLGQDLKDLLKAIFDPISGGSHQSEELFRECEQTNPLSVDLWNKLFDLYADNDEALTEVKKKIELYFAHQEFRRPNRFENAHISVNQLQRSIKPLVIPQQLLEDLKQYYEQQADQQGHFQPAVQQWIQQGLNQLPEDSSPETRQLLHEWLPELEKVKSLELLVVWLRENESKTLSDLVEMLDTREQLPAISIANIQSLLNYLDSVSKPELEQWLRDQETMPKLAEQQLPDSLSFTTRRILEILLKSPEQVVTLQQLADWLGGNEERKLIQVEAWLQFEEELATIVSQPTDEYRRNLQMLAQQLQGDLVPLERWLQNSSVQTSLRLIRSLSNPPGGNRGNSPLSRCEAQLALPEDQREPDQTLWESLFSLRVHENVDNSIKQQIDALFGEAAMGLNIEQLKTYLEWAFDPSMELDDKPVVQECCVWLLQHKLYQAEPTREQLLTLQHALDQNDLAQEHLQTLQEQVCAATPTEGQIETLRQLTRRPDLSLGQSRQLRTLMQKTQQAKEGLNSLQEQLQEAEDKHTVVRDLKTTIALTETQINLANELPAEAALQAIIQQAASIQQLLEKIQQQIPRTESARQELEAIQTEISSMSLTREQLEELWTLAVDQQLPALQSTVRLKIESSYPDWIWDHPELGRYNPFDPAYAELEIELSEGQLRSVHKHVLAHSSNGKLRGDLCLTASEAPGAGLLGETSATLMWAIAQDEGLTDGAQFEQMLDLIYDPDSNLDLTEEQANELLIWGQIYKFQEAIDAAYSRLVANDYNRVVELTLSDNARCREKASDCFAFFENVPEAFDSLSLDNRNLLLEQAVLNEATTLVFSVIRGNRGILCQLPSPLLESLQRSVGPGDLKQLIDEETTRRVLASFGSQ